MGIGVLKIELRRRRIHLNQGKPHHTNIGQLPEMGAVSYHHRPICGVKLNSTGMIQGRWVGKVIQAISIHVSRIGNRVLLHAVVRRRKRLDVLFQRSGAALPAFHLDWNIASTHIRVEHKVVAGG